MFNINNYTNFINRLFSPLNYGPLFGSPATQSEEIQSYQENNSLMHLMCMRRKADQGITMDENSDCSCISFGDEWPL